MKVIDVDYSFIGEAVYADFARKLERENAALREALERMLNYANGFTQHCASKPDAKTQARAALALAKA